MEFSSGCAAGPVLGGMAGAALAVGAAYWDVRRRRQEREGRRERPPIREKLLRPPGYSCACRFEGVSDQSETWCMVLLAAGIALGIASFGTLGAVRTFYVQNLSWRELLVHTGAGQVLLLPFLAVFSGLAFAHALRTLGKLRKERACLTLGLRGEQAVAEALAAPEVASAGYVVFHDVPAESRGRQFNLDHVVVGPAGVFVVETKTRVRRAAKNGQPEHEVVFDGETLRFPWCEDRNAVKQVLANTDWLKGALKDFGGERMTFYPVIVVPGWYVKTTVGTSAVKAMNAEYLAKHFIVPAKRVYTPEELRPIIAWLGDRCRTLEL